MRDIRAQRIVGFGLTSGNADRLTEFYATAFGARHVSSEYLTGAPFERQMRVTGGARCQTLQLGRETINILQFDAPGRPYPRPLSPDHTAFQHFALVVNNMNLALAQLHEVPGWTPISSGPQSLPQRSGGVSAFKFQDPDGHPLELLEFPEQAVPPSWKRRLAPGVFLGIDHSAFSVGDTAISTAFYRSLGFTLTAQTFNYGVEQANLDGVPNPQVDVSAMALDPSATPHIELLCYRSEARPPRAVLSSNDVAATRIMLATDCLEDDLDASSQLIVDPDGHHLLLMPLLSLSSAG